MANGKMAMAIRNIDAEVHTRLRKRSLAEGISMNQLVLRILEASLLPAMPKKVYHDLDHLYGSWSEEECREFARNQKPFNKVDRELWK
jgi:hypothetical protein